MEHKKIKAICFDYYGTLVEIGKPFQKLKDWFAESLKNRDITSNIERFYIYFSKQRIRLEKSSQFMLGQDILNKSYTLACAHFDIIPCISEFEQFIYHLFVSPKAYEDALDTLKEIRKKYRIGLVTNADNNILQKSLQQQKFTFDCVVSSEDAQCNKPKKDIFLKAANQLKVNTSEILFVGDSVEEDIEGALNCGMHAILISRSGKNIYSTTRYIKKLKELLNYI